MAAGGQGFVEQARLGRLAGTLAALETDEDAALCVDTGKPHDPNLRGGADSPDVRRPQSSGFRLPPGRTNR
ncbi:hypothetical protein GCM10010197_11700 [Nocardioides luteus]|uniref:DksA C4-type domain-containing protein n=1 Tax=Nocardioides luteus TaxID=1844 RepID=A0ABQ5SYX2_9ACTN|nr:hypothetical protein GCM10010197_11700 [Nocardioides luteus]GLJ69034.1 hypothetical protein GCM10017579_30700 [Nocardioides luteus]